jgi:eukaryotic-like serine/threonine-protein kinase
MVANAASIITQMEYGFMIGLSQRLVLNSDVVVRQANLTVSSSSGNGDDDFFVTRTGSRSPTLAVNRETAEFLLAFSVPSSLLNGVQLISKRVDSKPHSILEEIYPTLLLFLDRGLLVRVGNTRRGLDVRRIGAWSLERPINDFDDSSVFLVKNDRGQFGALKLIRTKGVSGVLERERRVLELGASDIVPALLDAGSSPFGPYIVSEWKSGSVAADTFRSLRSSQRSRPEMLRMAGTLLEAFERLHERGIIHGDIQPKNVIFDLHDRAWIIDFTHSVVPSLPAPTWRMGVPFFFEPEHARDLLETPPKMRPLSLQGENYAIAALLYYLLSGVHSIEFALEKESMMRQIAEQKPRSLSDPAGLEWTAVDAAIRPYLAKRPEERSLSLLPLRDALHAALLEEAAVPSEPHDSGSLSFQVQRKVSPERALEKGFGLRSELLRDYRVLSPHCSLTYGATGIAYALLRAAELCENAELLWAADAWIEQAEQRADQPEAFTSERLDLTRRRIGYASVACSEPGLYFVKSLVRSATGDSEGSRRAVGQFLTAANRRRRSHHADVNLGGVGLALAADRLRLLPLPLADRRQLLEFRDDLVAKAWQKVRPSIHGKPRLGFAHGIAGMVFASLTCGRSPEAQEAGARLRTLPVMLRKGIHWPVRAQGHSFMPGWCNGVAGHLMMWMRMWQCFGIAEDREMMERAAWGVLESRTSMGNLCCGAAGQAAALASFSVAVGEPIWQQRASEFINSLEPKWPKDDHAQSLFRGELGLHLVRLECEAGVPSEFPVWGSSLAQN